MLINYIILSGIFVNAWLNVSFIRVGCIAIL